jgi:outer membrane protein
VATALVASFAATSARADTSANDWHDGPFQLRLRGVYAHPDTGSDAFALGSTQIPGNQAKLDSEFYPELSGEYYFTDSLSTELAVALPTKFKASVSGTAIGSEKLMPNTWTLKYAFNVPETFRPYLGAGVHYTDISSQQLAIPAGSFANAGLAATPLSTDSSKFGWVGQAGVDIRVARAWFVNLDARYLGNLTTKLNDSATGTELTNL